MMTVLKRSIALTGKYFLSLHPAAAVQRYEGDATVHTVVRNGGVSGLIHAWDGLQWGEFAKLLAVKL